MAFWRTEKVKSDAVLHYVGLRGDYGRPQARPWQLPGVAEALAVVEDRKCVAGNNHRLLAAMEYETDCCVRFRL